MTDLTRRIEVLREVDAWFGARGFGLVLTEEDDEYWVHLFPKSSLQIHARRYGRGPSPEAAEGTSSDYWSVLLDPNRA